MKSNALASLAASSTCHQHQHPHLSCLADMNFPQDLLGSGLFGKPSKQNTREAFELPAGAVALLGAFYLQGPRLLEKHCKNWKTSCQNISIDPLGMPFESVQ